MKVAVYIDGFNFYHAVAALNRPEIKWLNLRKLAESFCGAGDKLEIVRCRPGIRTKGPGIGSTFTLLKPLGSRFISTAVRFPRLAGVQHPFARVSAPQSVMAGLDPAIHDPPLALANDHCKQPRPWPARGCPHRVRA